VQYAYVLALRTSRGQDLGDALTAEALYRQAVALDPGFAGARSNLGNLLKEQFKLAEALVEYDVRGAA
jgi:Flp pilus assembly protein TadD